MPTSSHSISIGLFIFVLASLVSTTVGAEQIQSNNPVIALINGKDLHKEGFLSFVNSRIANRHGTQLNQDQLQGLLHEYINRELIYQDALIKGLDKAAQVTLAIANQSHNIIASYSVKNLLGKAPNEKTLAEIYQKNFEKPTIEYKTRHILLDEENKALRIITLLDQGEDFAKLARRSSLDTSAKDGGELNWFSPRQMSPVFMASVAKLQAGQFTHTPVKTRYGWHVIQLQKTRQIPPPPFAQVKDEIVRQWQKEALTHYIRTLRKQAKIEIK